MSCDRDELLATADWDTQCFGFPVAHIKAAEPSPPIADALARAQERGIRLVYWSGQPSSEVPAEVLQRYHGALLDRKVTYRRALTKDDRDEPLYLPREWTLSRLPRMPAPASLVKLAIQAGGHSRFRVDPRFPPTAFEAMYRTWIDRSTRGEIADAVQVLAPTAYPTDFCGMVTVAIEGAAGRIGLIAVDAAQRGRGLGRMLLRAAHQAMARRGCDHALVTTQRDNLPACRLYEQAGYVIDAARDVYHFWPLAS